MGGGRTLKITKTADPVSQAPQTGDTPSTVSIWGRLKCCDCMVWGNPSASLCCDCTCEAIPLHHFVLTVLPKLAPFGATHFRLACQSFSDQLHLEAVGMKEYNKEISLGLTCRKAFSNTSTRAVTVFWRGKGGFLHVFISDIIYTPMEAYFLLSFCFPKYTNNTNMHTRRLPDS